MRWSASRFMVMAAWGVWERRRQATDGQTRLAALAWAAPLTGAVLVIVAAVLFFQAPAAASKDDLARAAVAASDQPALDILSKAGAYSQNQLRLWAFGSPDQVERYGSWEAENLRVWSQHLSDYTATLFGHGYLAPVNLSVLKPVQLNDNVSTIHVMAPYGRFGAAALLLCLGVLAAAAARVTRPEVTLENGGAARTGASDRPHVAVDPVRGRRLCGAGQSAAGAVHGAQRLSAGRRLGQRSAGGDDPVHHGLVRPDGGPVRACAHA
jgi:hypothetical protein